MNTIEKRIQAYLSKMPKQKVELARSTQIINAANKLMNNSESIQDSIDSKLTLFEKTRDNLILEGRNLQRNIGDMIDAQADIKQEMKELSDILKSLGAPTSASKEYGLLENALNGLGDLISFGNKINNDIKKYN